MATTDHQAHDPRDRRPIRARGARWAQFIARRLAATGVSPNSISVFGMLAAVAAGAALALTDVATGFARPLWLASAVLIVVRLLANLFDGMVAMEAGKASPTGELYNEVPDRISDAAVLIGAGYATGGSVELGYLAACVALFVAYTRAAAKVAGAPSDFRGPLAKQQRMHVVAIAALFMAVTPSGWRLAWGPDAAWGVMAAALLLVAAGGAFTAARRLRRAARTLGGK